VTGLAVGMLVPCAVHAQSSPRVWRIVFLSPIPREAALSRYQGFVQGLRDLGYIEGHNVQIDYRSSDGQYERLRDVALEAVRTKPDVIVAYVTHATVAAKNAAGSIPVVMIGVADPVGTGLVSSLSRPGGNVTGNSSVSTAVAGKSLELLAEIVPKPSRVGVLWNSSNSIFQGQMLREIESAATALRLTYHTVGARDSKEIDAAFAEFRQQRVAALTVLSDPVFATHRIRIVTAAARGRLPSISGFKEFAEAGGLMAYCRELRGPHPERREAPRSSRGAADEIRACGQPQDGESAGPHHPAVTAAAGGSGD
jgi:putative ABC transport system substrate-binding protein